MILVGTTDGAPLAVADGRLGDGTSVFGAADGSALPADELPVGVGPLADPSVVLVLGVDDALLSASRPPVSTTASTTMAATTATAAAINPIRTRERASEPGEAVDMQTFCAEGRTALVGADPGQDNGSPLPSAPS